jgi:hypothetical protein
MAKIDRIWLWYDYEICYIINNDNDNDNEIENIYKIYDELFIYEDRIKCHLFFIYF